MSSKRLLDLLILAAATKQILGQHIGLRSSQLSLYSQTSSLTRPLRARRVARNAARVQPGQRPEEGKRDNVAEAETKPDVPRTAVEEEEEEQVGVLDDGKDNDKDLDVQALASNQDIPRGNPSIAVPEEPPSASTAEVLLPASVDIQSLTPDEASTISTTPSPTRTELNIRQENNAPPAPTITPAELDLTIQSLTTDTPTTESSQLAQQLATSPSGHTMTASRVPSSRFSRMMHYTGLGLGMTFGALTEGVKRATVGSSSSAGGPQTSLMLNEANVERLVKKLSRMRGAALKLGQMLSFQDSKLLPPPLHQILSRVQDSADYMPPSQLHPILTRTLGPNWESLFQTFNLTPLAAASIGQVHLATLSPHLIPTTDPRSPSHPNHTPGPYPVAVKIQYPGIKTSISSDLTNLSLLLTASRLLPKGLYLDKTISNARTELAWECDYTRELSGINKFRALLPPSHNNPFTIPHAIPEASGEDILTMEFMPGKSITRINDLTQSERDFLGTEILRLSLMEIARFRCMQTDPNFSNFLFDRDSGKIQLLDFGAWREYPEDFVDTYLSLLRAARRRDAQSCKDLSIKLGYLTGLESRTMTDAHIESIFILAEPFRGAGAGSGGVTERYDFSTQTVTERVKSLIPVMLRERLTPPPEETYSLHRKMSGAFLVCARLQSRVDCEGVFAEVVGF
ncbi:ABC1-domain-containing protein [Terfezia boudieri ATCC MYA-4762]|uniref:ABC1-domain-containing protein n=1 Tax=Terfezia boudieri ATCC MYA-4762 TaxID=1051890 RepID=A0A3N4LGW9_9PEZI|nr:ABC1-domain-containing protein [Terfezia boudieri ATCC MYA-4762]